MGCIGFRCDTVDADPVVIGAGCIGGGEVYRPFEGSTGGYPEAGSGSVSPYPLWRWYCPETGSRKGLRGWQPLFRDFG